MYTYVLGDTEKALRKEVVTFRQNKTKQPGGEHFHLSGDIMPDLKVTYFRSIVAY